MQCTERIRELRQEKDYRQSYIANVLRVAQTTYSDYEKGKIRIPIECIIALAQLYDVDLNFIVGVSEIRNAFPNTEKKSKTDSFLTEKKTTE